MDEHAILQLSVSFRFFVRITEKSRSKLKEQDIYTALGILDRTRDYRIGKKTARRVSCGCHHIEKFCSQFGRIQVQQGLISIRIQR